MMARFTDPMNLALSILLAGIFLLLPVLLAEMVIILPLTARCSTLPAGEPRIPRDDGMEY
jgi:hypothetical protein